MNTKSKKMLFKPSKSLYNNAFKFHKIDNDTLLISLKANEDYIGYTEKLFPGDDRDRITNRKPSEKYLKYLLKD